MTAPLRVVATMASAAVLLGLADLVATACRGATAMRDASRTLVVPAGLLFLGGCSWSLLIQRLRRSQARSIGSRIASAFVAVFGAMILLWSCAELIEGIRGAGIAILLDPVALIVLCLSIGLGLWCAVGGARETAIPARRKKEGVT